MTSERPHGASETLTWRSRWDKYCEIFLFLGVYVKIVKREKSVTVFAHRLGLSIGFLLDLLFVALRLKRPFSVLGVLVTIVLVGALD